MESGASALVLSGQPLTAATPDGSFNFLESHARVRLRFKKIGCGQSAQPRRYLEQDSNRLNQKEDSHI